MTDLYCSTPDNRCRIGYHGNRNCIDFWCDALFLRATRNETKSNCEFVRDTME